MKGKVYKMAIKPATMCGLESVAIMKNQETALRVAELSMLRGSR